jgi:hypothetical protein
MVQREQYERLKQHLRADGRLRIDMTIREVERIVGDELPYSAHHYPAWWGRDPKHTQAVWLDAGYTAHPDLVMKLVTFTRDAL